MSDETPERPEESDGGETAKKRVTRKRITPVKNVRRVTTVARDAGPRNEIHTDDQGDGESPVSAGETDAPRPSRGGDDRFDSSDGDDSGEPVAVIVDPSGSEVSGQGSKKRRRRRKKSGNHPEGGDEPREGPPPATHSPTMQAAPRPKLDGDQVAKKAWRIYLSEVSEEGLALISDQDARELSRRCFRLAEIFLDEAGRHR